MQLNVPKRLHAIRTEELDETVYKALFDNTYKILRRFKYKYVGYAQYPYGYRFIKIKGVGDSGSGNHLLVSAFDKLLSKEGYKLVVDNKKYNIVQKYISCYWYKENEDGSGPEVSLCISENYDINYSVVLLAVSDGPNFSVYNTPYLSLRR